jgi:hypothetical protein
VTLEPICLDCKHLDRTEPGLMRCAAFPDEIPIAIQLMDHDHHEPYPGDRGIRFEPLEDDHAGQESGARRGPLRRR